MQEPAQFNPVEMGDGIVTFPAQAPLPGLGILPVNSFLLDGDEPVLIDTGIPPLAEALVDSIDSCVAVRSLRWIWLTHMDPDHLGALSLILDAAPDARIVTTFLGAGKLGLLGYPADRVHLVTPGETLVAGSRKLLAIRPPYFDAPETVGLWDAAGSALFCADSFGGLMNRPAERADDLSDDEYRRGLTAWLEIDNPWLGEIAPARFAASLQKFRMLGARKLLSSHLPLAGEDHSRLYSTLLEVQAKLAMPSEMEVA